MGTLLTLRYSKDLPCELAGQLGSHCHISGSELSVFNIEQAAIKKIAAHMTPFNKWLIFGPYFVPGEQRDYLSADVIGAVLGPGEVQGSGNSASDFDPAWPAPCSGLVKDGIAIECRFKPKGHVEMIGDNLIFSKQIVHLLGSENVGRTTHVVQLKGKLVENWIGFDFRDKLRVVNPICFDHPTDCTLCRTSFTPWRGVWVGKSQTGCQVEACTDLIGYEHHQSRHPIVVSKELATTIEKALGGKGFNLEPMFALTSKYADLITAICSYFRREVTHPRHD